MVIVKKGAGVWLNNDTVLRFQVDDQENPYKELRRVVENWNKSSRQSPGEARPVMDAREFRDLLTHMEWADAETWRAVRDLEAAQSDERLRVVVPSFAPRAVDLSAGLARRSVCADGIEGVSGSARPSKHGRSPYYPRVTAFAKSSRRITIRAAGRISVVGDDRREVRQGAARDAWRERVSSDHAHGVSPWPDLDAHPRDRRRAAAHRFSLLGVGRKAGAAVMTTLPGPA